ncbi:glutamate racemase [Maridesulfovibrio ferrireducens]|uniref:glutamate racemase n=1 Tax=Maridesulfovibrio ferrireducens TaxID=246191 RepID=UPI001A1AE380|nr:glutamate racemase [Maridesulfovibrio ferrireducens]MBI9111804.1 glutamate racemase [Maridesulfovibrio ferrireducens]
MSVDKCNLPIGVFDSGVGGLTVLRALQDLLPHENFLYLGDTARVPYGAKSADSVIKYALQAGDALVAEGIKMLVIACNTASAVSLKSLADKYSPLPVIGVIKPGAEAACLASVNGKIAVIATENTVNGGAYQRTICSMHPNAEIIAQPCPLFVGLAEEGWTEGELVEAIAARYLEPLFAKFGDEGPDTLVLGCTHFPVLRGAIANVAGKKIKLVDSAETTAKTVKNILAESKLGNCSTQLGHISFLATDSAKRFAAVGGAFLGVEIDPKDVKVIDL